MKKALAGILLALGVLGAVAGVSGREMANSELAHIKNRWAVLQSMPANQRTAAEVSALREQARGLADRYPGREEIRAWERVIERTANHWRYQEDAPT